ncbi:acyl-CoA thioesterase [Halocynthiibacter sp. C4]|uniref:acyl-CoA thioesterase n=1 Tax=Halocynthiibacter sp. C4 TaxID=2992758 RepID=UPI00237BAC09|nr:acyl-CoA thioesterase [Halocynthiibacter sp. C4]MDE0591410.1 acyl-CoA thioesterase [Halocynthiibacter sp. C4]
MYPFIRLFKEAVKYRNATPLKVGENHVSHHICWPWDLDMWAELNNGRALSLYDLGRIPLARRMGLIKVLRREKWGLAVAGTSIRYRRRIRAFDKIEMRSRLVSWDERFIYLEQGMWVRGECASHALFRTAVTDRNGIVSTKRVMDALGLEATAPEMPQWSAAWVDADTKRPWPPMGDTAITP